MYSKRVWGWMFFDWASQPYLTLLLTFIFGPYFAQIVIADLVADGTDAATAKATAQAWWGYGLTAVGLTIAVLAPILGAVADHSGQRMRWIGVFSVLYVIGATGLWWAVPDAPPVVMILALFGLGFVGAEFATIFVNALLPDLGPPATLGRISGTGWALGYVGGILALAIMLVFFADTPEGTTLLGIAPLFGLDPDLREGTRFVGPFVAVWYLVFMIPFALWVRDAPAPLARAHPTITETLRDLGRTLWALPRHRSRFAFLLSALFYRDGLNGLFTFGGIYALGVLGWSVTDIGVFGILAAFSGAVFAWLGGKADDRFGPKPVIIACISILVLTASAVVSLTQTSVLGVLVGATSPWPTIAFFIAGALIGAAGGALQSASRTMMVRQADPDRMTEGFGLYALSGKATTWLAPLLIAVVTEATGSQRLGILPLIGLFLAGLLLLVWVKPNGEPRP